MKIGKIYERYAVWDWCNDRPLSGEFNQLFHALDMKASLLISYPILEGRTAIRIIKYSPEAYTQVRQRDLK